MIRIIVIPGNGIGPEVVNSGLQLIRFVFEKLSIPYVIDNLELNDDTYFSIDRVAVEKVIKKCSEYDYILFGAVGEADMRKNTYGGGLLLDLRKHFNLYINSRPARQISNLLSPLKDGKPFDVLIIRENTECAYVNIGGRYKENTPDEIAIQEMVYTRKTTSKTIAYAFESAMSRKKHLVLCDKSNVLKYGHGLWRDVFYETAEKYPEVNIEHIYVDALAAKLVRNPSHFDVIVAPNMFGDILSDLTSELQGGIGTSGSMNHGDLKPTLIEPVHGSANDIANKGIANPLGTINAVSLMFNNLKLNHVVEKINTSIIKLIGEGKTTPDLGGTLSTGEFTNTLISYIKEEF
jgi:3-isopropylmalate dehydrogenase